MAYRAVRFWRDDRPFLARPDGDRFRFWVHFVLGAVFGVILGGLHLSFLDIEGTAATVAVLGAFTLGVGWACGRYGNSFWEFLFSSRSGFGP